MNSNQSTFNGKPSIANTDRNRRRLSTERATDATRGLLSALAFWSAIALPVFYLPFFVIGIETFDRLGLFVSLFGLHMMALIGGRRRHTDTLKND